MIISKKIFLLIVILPLLLLSCKKESNSVATTLSPAEMERLEEIADEAGQIASIRSLLIQYDDETIIERYYHYANALMKDDVMSVTKSVTSALIGIAVDKGYIENVDQTLSDFLEGVVEPDEQRGAITIRQLLMMSCGLEWHGLTTSEDYLAWIDAPDQLTYILDKPFDHTPGVDFNYSDGAAHLLSAILTEATGQSAHDFARQYLFEPLGIDNTAWGEDNRGYTIGSTQLQISANNMLKFGNLFLHKGMWNGERIISREWIETSTATHLSTHNAIPYGSNYSYLWWVGEYRDHSFYFANGYGGQFIVVVPDFKLVVVATANWRYSDQEAGQYWYQIIQTIMDDILPVFNR